MEKPVRSNKSRGQCFASTKQIHLIEESTIVPYLPKEQFPLDKVQADEDIKIYCCANTPLTEQYTEILADLAH